jgi:hypothetical protein
MEGDPCLDQQNRSWPETLLRMFELAKEHHRADKTYRAYSTWMKRTFSGWTPLPETIKVWKHAIGE